MTEVLQAFHFLRPFWLVALIPALVLVYLLLRERAEGSQWRRYIAPQLLKLLLDQNQAARKKWPLYALLALWSYATIALAGPTWQRAPQPVERSAQATVICWDLSPSMLAQDIAPSRLERARLKIIDLLKSREDGLFALVTYSGEAYTVTPLTDDVQTIINLLPALSPTQLPTVGSNPEMAFTSARSLLADGGANSGQIVMVTDGIDEGAFDFLTEAARQSPYRLIVWGVGTPQGAPIPLPGGGFAKDARGNMVVPGLNEQALQAFTRRAGAYYVPMVTNESDISTLDQLMTPIAEQTVKTTKDFDQWLDQGQYLPLLLLPFVALLFRRGWLFAFILVLPLAMQPKTAWALSWQDLWLNQDQRAQAALEAGESEAAKQFTEPHRRGSAFFDQQNYEAAADEFAQMDSAVGRYNRGTALTQAGQFDAAIDAFKAALEEDPEFRAAQKNLEVAQALKEAEQRQAEQNQQQSGDQHDPENSQSNEDNSKSEETGQGDGQQDGAGQQTADNDQSDSAQGAEQTSKSDDPNAAQSSESGDESDANDTSSHDNPYAGMTPDEAQQAQQQAEQQTPTEAAEEGLESQTKALTGVEDAEQNEKQRQLELMLRKVPDDPGGLLREKFKYQYMQRRQDPNQSRRNTEAENRW